jgi:hypothetical protein
MVVQSRTGVKMEKFCQCGCGTWVVNKFAVGHKARPKLKKCRKCEKFKNREKDFRYRNTGAVGGGKQTLCKTCQVDEARERRHANPAWQLRQQAMSRVRKTGLPFSIKTEDVIVPKLCPVFGFRLQRGRGEKSPSLDRIIPELGYVPGNVQVISHKANTMKSNASPEELKKFAQWVLKNA